MSTSSRSGACCAHKRSIFPAASRGAKAMIQSLPPRPPMWSALIAAALGDVHEQQVWRVLRAQKIDLSGRKSWCESDDPEFAAKAADVVGLDRGRTGRCPRAAGLARAARTKDRSFRPQVVVRKR